MRRREINEAKKSAKEFIARVSEYEARVSEDDYLELVGTRESGAVRRASMDLTRALSKMRRPAK